MGKLTCTIELLPHGRRIEANGGESVLEALLANDIFLRSDCGGRGRCGKCRVEAMAGDGSVNTGLACTMAVAGDISLRIPEESLLSAHIVDKAPVVLPESFGSRIAQRGAAIPGIAVDLGTTTIAVYFCDLEKKAVISSVAVKNPQALYGDDVMSRIGWIGADPARLGRLQRLAVGAIDWGMRSLFAKTELSAERLREMVVVGNPAMIHILLGVSPHSIGISPYAPQFYEARRVRAVDLGLDYTRLTVQTLPQVSGFLGGDILAAALATELAAQPPGTLLVDLGTNGELVLQGRDGLYATSCATGPAFEGAALSCGMQATPGAIDRVVVNGVESPRYSVVRKSGGGEVQPSGLCGSGVVSAVSALLRAGIVERSGLFSRSLAVPHLLESGHGRRYVIAPADRTAYGREVALSQKDLRAVQLGKGALGTGIEFLLEAAGIETVRQILVAGAFGSYLDKGDMAALGMIPSIAPDRVKMVGNAAGAGAIMALCEEKYQTRSRELAAAMKIVELAANSRFQDCFVRNLSFPAISEGECG